MEEQTTQTPPPQPPPAQPAKKNTGMAAVAYILFFVPLLTDSKDDPFVKYHVRQGLVLFLGAVIVWLVGNVIPVLGLIIAPILNIVLLVLLIIGVINASKGKENPLPLIGHLADKFKF